MPERRSEPAYAPVLGRPLRVLVIDSVAERGGDDRALPACLGDGDDAHDEPQPALERFGAARRARALRRRDDRASSRATSAAAELAHELHEPAGESELFVIALVDIGERVADTAASAPDLRRRGCQADQAVALYEALAGIVARSRTSRTGRVAAPTTASCAACAS